MRCVLPPHTRACNCCDVPGRCRWQSSWFYGRYGSLLVRARKITRVKPCEVEALERMDGRPREERRRSEDPENPAMFMGIRVRGGVHKKGGGGLPGFPAPVDGLPGFAIPRPSRVVSKCA